MLRERSNTTGSFAEHLNFPEKRISFSYGIWGSSGKLKSKNKAEDI